MSGCTRCLASIAWMRWACLPRKIYGVLFIDIPPDFLGEMNDLVSMRLFIFTFVVWFGLPLQAAENLLQLESRPGVTIPVFYIKAAQARASVILLPGGYGGIGALRAGKPTGQNFLVRSRDFFAEAGLNVAVMSKASDWDDLTYADRITPAHVHDIQVLVDFLHKDTGLPVWLVGTSRGTISATAAAIAFGDEKLAGLVLASSIVNTAVTGAIPRQALDRIHIPVLLIHHRQDACAICNPGAVPGVLDALKNAPVKKLVWVAGGDNPSGDACGALHYHGYIGIEKATVDTISAWMLRPTP